jgi:hypothetical protein
VLKFSHLGLCWAKTQCEGSIHLSNQYRGNGERPQGLHPKTSTMTLTLKGALCRLET